MTTQRALPEVWYRFACKVCRFVRQSRDRERAQLEHCPGCGYPKELAGHVYRREPQDGDDLDG